MYISLCTSSGIHVLRYLLDIHTLSLGACQCSILQHWQTCTSQHLNHQYVGVPFLSKSWSFSDFFFSNFCSSNVSNTIMVLICIFLLTSATHHLPRLLHVFHILSNVYSGPVPSFLLNFFS